MLRIVHAPSCLRILPVLAGALALAGCDFMATEAPAGRGFANIGISLAAVGSPLEKPSSAMGKKDTLLTLASLELELSCPGLPTQTRKINLSGNIHAGSITPASQVFSLYGMKNWKLRAWTKDIKDSVIHKDSTTLFVVPGDTTTLQMPLNPRYAVLIGRFISQSDKITAIEKLELRINGIVVDDTVFNSKQKVFDVILSNKYVRLGQNTTVEMRALDKTTPDRVKYAKMVVIDPDESVESMITIKLE